MNKAFEKILERLEEDARFYNSASDVDQNIRSGLIIAKEAVQEVVEEYNNGWIPCSSGVLPKRSNSYCVTKMFENDGNPIYETCHEIFYTIDNKWDCERDEDYEWRVIAWKEKDKPYQPKGEKGE